jgi:hypothetical protein
MTKKTFIILFIAAAVLLIVSYCQFGTKPDVPKTTSSTASSGKKMIKATLPPPDASAPVSNGGAGFLPTQMEDPRKFEAYQQNLLQMAECLNMKVGVLDPQAEINFDYFNSVISADLGDIVAEAEEWSAVDIRTNSGEVRRIYIENSTSGEPDPQRTLKYYSIGTGGEHKELPLSKDQMSSPSDSLIASLEKDGDVIGRSVSRRIFYQNGDDLLLVERNGKIYSFQLPHDGKTFSCTGADSSSTMKCQCK